MPPWFLPPNSTSANLVESKHKIRNPKQVQMTKIRMSQTNNSTGLSGLCFEFRPRHIGTNFGFPENHHNYLFNMALHPFLRIK